MDADKDASLYVCDDCGVAAECDAVLLDVDAHNASGEAYCETCHPRHIIIAGDKWRPM